VVERTIERVAAPETNGASAAIPAREVTVVVKEEEFVTKAVQEAHNAIVRIKNKKDGALLGIGVVINREGLIVADRTATLSYREYSGVYLGTAYDIVPVANDKKSGIITFKFKDAFPTNLDPIAIGDSEKLLPGQSVVAVSGADRDTVSIGIISSLIRSADEAKALYAVDTTVSQGSLLSGTPLMDLNGKVVALKIGKDDEEMDILMPIASVMAAVSALAITQ
jgi:S1-C subfamily serine protease